MALKREKVLHVWRLLFGIRKMTKLEMAGASYMEVFPRGQGLMQVKMLYEPVIKDEVILNKSNTNKRFKMLRIFHINIG